jgi:hypothetical protein
MTTTTTGTNCYDNWHYYCCYYCYCHWYSYVAHGCRKRRTLLALLRPRLQRLCYYCCCIYGHHYHWYYYCYHYCCYCYTQPRLLVYDNLNTTLHRKRRTLLKTCCEINLCCMGHV